MTAVIHLAQVRRASTEEDRLPLVVAKLETALAQPGRVDLQIMRAWSWINDVANDDQDTVNAIRELVLVNPTECMDLQRRHLSEMIQKYAEEHLDDLIEYFHLTDADRAYDAALDAGEA